MKYLFELSKEYQSLSKSEVLGCLKAEEISYEVIESNEDILIIETKGNEKGIKNLSDRLSMTFFIDEFLFSSNTDLTDINRNAEEKSFKKPGSVAIKYKNRSKNVDSKRIVRKLASVYTKDRTVALNSPDNEIRALITDSNVYVGIKISEINRSDFEKRKVQHRPFFSPITLHPKLARAFVNLSAVKRNEILLDPFCGTGGMLLEAGLVGAKLIGSDIEEKMVEGCKKTLDFYKIKNCKVFCSDIGNIEKYVKKVDAVVTDLPYGKATTTKGENINKLYDRAFQSMSLVLKKNSRAVIGLADIDMLDIGKKYFKLIEKHELRAHKSLTRHFAVFEK